MQSDYLGRKPGDPGTALHALRAIMASQKADKATDKTKAALAPRKAAMPAPRAMTDAEAIVAHRHKTVADLQSGSAAKGVRTVIAESAGKAAVSSSAGPIEPAKPTHAEATASWDIVIAAQRAELEGYFHHAR